MLTLHPNILENNGIKQFAVLSFEEYGKIKNELQDFEDLKTLRKAKSKEGNIAGVTLEKAKIEFGLI